MHESRRANLAEMLFVRARTRADNDHARQPRTKAKAMRIIDRGFGFTVEADWFGAIRVVFRGDVFACIAFVRDRA